MTQRAPPIPPPPGLHRLAGNGNDGTDDEPVTRGEFRQARAEWAERDASIIAELVVIHQGLDRLAKHIEVPGSSPPLPPVPPVRDKLQSGHFADYDDDVKTDGGTRLRVADGPNLTAQQLTDRNRAEWEAWSVQRDQRLALERDASITREVRARGRTITSTLLIQGLGAVMLSLIAWLIAKLQKWI